MYPRNPRSRERAAILGLFVLGIIVLIVLAHIQQASGNEPNRVERYECGKAVGVHDGKPGYHIIQHAHYVEYEDGSGVLYCGSHVMVRVGVPW